MIYKKNFLIGLSNDVSRDLIRVETFHEADNIAKVMVNLELAEAHTEKLLSCIREELKELRK